jgi:hypothetical protein
VATGAATPGALDDAPPVTATMSESLMTSTAIAGTPPTTTLTFPSTLNAGPG